MSHYPGNTSLTDAVKERVQSTFQQTLALYKQGRTEEVIQGCGLILRMDPMFDPAKKLMEKARNPSSPISVEVLLQATVDPMARARAAMAARDFQKVIDITTEILTSDLMNEEARVMNEQAREKMEAAPFVDQFVQKTEQAIASGDVAAARSGLEKIRSLDADDTAMGRLEQAVGKMKPAQPASPSFVVDTPQQPGSRGTAQAKDFGFTFEEEKGQQSGLGSFSFDSPSAASPFSTDTGTVPPITPPSGFSFDSPAPVAPAPPPPPPQSPGTPFSFDTPPPSPSPFSFDTPPPMPAAPVKEPGALEFDFTTAPTETTPDDQKKIQQYLDDGDRAFETGNYQQAIDFWSRIFLIDVTNEQASERIERAKLKRGEIEQRLEGILTAGVQAFERKDHNTAREKFSEVLRLDPTNVTAEDYLERLNQVPVEGGAAGYEAPFTPPEPTPDVFADQPSTAGSFEPALIPPSAAPSAAPIAAKKAAAKTAAKAPAAAKAAPMRAIAAVVGLVVLAAAGWFAWSKFMSKPVSDTAATAGIFTHANSLAQKGQYDAAIALLQDVKPDDPQHDKALSMIADVQRKKGQASEMVDGRPAAIVYQEGLTAGKAAFDAHDYDAAKKAFESAARVKSLPPDMKALYDIVAQQSGKLEGARTLFKEQRYQEALTSLQSLQQQEPQNQSIKRMISDAHFNLGAIALQEERLPDAIREFDEVLKIDPNDELARRSKGLAERYDGQAKDLLYKIYVKYLPTRKVT
jgi:tetratricopeptide (TPR) repeat protein